MNRQELKVEIKRLLRESLNDRSEYAQGYAAGQDNYHEKNMITNWKDSNHPEEYKKGYLQGVKDARSGKYNGWIKKFLSAIGLSGGATYGAHKRDIKWKS